ncbi:hypothetical protein PCO31111_02448 [Pandoraea communis]|uniref:Uncharacterized protein n=1 Tax=Pandoraea communis TaxID=2508297 RepID=A0A5E4V3W5_9BURK|nr:hypothetical protein PCO31111_02448 [Pandoraea communis]
MMTLCFTVHGNHGYTMGAQHAFNETQFVPGSGQYGEAVWGNALRA